MKGIAITSILALSGVIILIGLGFSMFTGGNISSGLFGWQGTVLEGVEIFFTNVYNTIVVISGWMTIGVMGIIFIAIQGVFIYFYYKLFQIARIFKPAVERILKEITEF
jgi:hypothetical protein